MNRRAFTLIELTLAIAGAAMLLAAVFGVFTRAIRLRDAATERARQTQMRTHALSVLRADLANGTLTKPDAAQSANTFANVLSTSYGAASSFPGQLALTTTTGHDDEVDPPLGDVQLVQYYVAAHPDGNDPRTGRLVRTRQQDFLATSKLAPAEELLLEGVRGLEVSFFDGSSWQDSWEYDPTDDETSQVPKAIRVRIDLATDAPDARNAPRLEVLVPWTSVALTR